MARPFNWNILPHQRKLQAALRDRIRDGAPLACIWEDARIGSYADPSHESFSIDEAIQAIKNCLNDDQRRNLETGTAVRVLGYNVDGKQQKLELKINEDGHAVLKGKWGSIMRKNEWNRETRICFWGFPYGGRNGGEPCFVFTNNI